MLGEKPLKSTKNAGIRKPINENPYKVNGWTNNENHPSRKL
jgi:hypothetical protein